MSERFIKFIPSEKSLHLVSNHPNAFILLTFIATRARRENGHPDGLTVGQCRIGDHENMGLSRQEYRTALSILILKNLIEKVETCRTRQKSTTGSTTIGTLVRICDNTIYDINLNDTNQRPNHRPTTDQPPTNHEQERIRKKKKEEEKHIPLTPLSPDPPKIEFREHVQLSQKEFDTLLAKYGQEFLNKMLDTLDAYKGSSGKKYNSDYHTMKAGGWVVERVEKDLQSRITPNEKPQGSSHPSSQPKFQASRVLKGSNVKGDS
jgi:hypothetical protein